MGLLRDLGLRTLEAMGRAVPSRVWKRALARRADLPLSVNLDSTDECNLACIHCVRENYAAEPGRKAKIMDFETFSRLSDMIPFLLIVNFDDRGEPLMNPDIFRMVRHVKHLSGGSTQASFNSNLMLLTRARAEEMVDCGLDRLQISLDGGDAAAFERIRLKARFDQVVENALMLQEVKRLKGSRTPRLSMNFVAMRSNVETLPGAAEVAARIGVDYLGVNGIEPYTTTMQDEILYHADGPNAPRPEHAAPFREAQAIARRAGVGWVPARMTPDRGAVCQVALDSCAISWDGFVHPCTFLAHASDVYTFKEKYRRPRHHFGNIRETGLNEIWKSPRYRAYRQAMSEGRDPDFCRDCLVKQGCICHGVA